MCDTFRPLRLTRLAQELDDPSYATSWHTPAEAAVS
jgi:homogentisate 1,2-dioxygenase